MAEWCRQAAGVSTGEVTALSEMLILGGVGLDSTKDTLTPADAVGGEGDTSCFKRRVDAALPSALTSAQRLRTKDLTSHRQQDKDKCRRYESR